MYVHAVLWHGTDYRLGSLGHITVHLIEAIVRLSIHPTAKVIA